MKSALFMAALCCTTLAACSSSEAPTDARVGVYTLVTINGTALPVTTLQNAAITQVIIAGQLALTADGRFGETRIGNVTPTGGTTSQVTSNQSGTWTDQQASDGSRNQLVFTSLDSQGKTLATFPGTFSGNQITATLNGGTWVYTKN